MQPFVFGSGYDQVANQRMGYDQLAVQMAEKDRQARVDAFDKAQQAAIFQQRQSEQDARQRQAQAYQFSQSAQAEQDRQNEMSRRAFEFGVTSKQRDDSEARIAKDSDRGFDLQKETNAASLARRDQDGDYKEAVNRIDNGMITKPEDIDTLFPNMSADQKARAATYWKSQNDRAHENYQSVDNYAKAANSIVKATRAKSGSGIIPLTEDDASAMLAKEKETRPWLPHLKWDEATQQWSPLMPKPYTVPPPVPPTADAGPTGFQIPFTPASARIPFPSSIRMDAPVVAPSPTPMPTPAAPSGNGWQTALGIGLNTLGLPDVPKMFAPRQVTAPAPAEVASPAPAGFSFPMSPAAFAPRGIPSAGPVSFPPPAPAVAPVVPPPVAAVAPVGPARPQTQQDLDSYPSGTMYVNPSDGKIYRKK